MAKVDGARERSSNGASKKAGKGKGSDTVWFNPKPDAGDLEWLDSQAGVYIQFIVTLIEALQIGERLSVRWDAHSGRWLAILFLDPSDEGGNVHALSVRGATAFDAAVLLYYFHHVKFADGWVTDASPVAGRFG